MSSCGPATCICCTAPRAGSGFTAFRLRTMWKSRDARSCGGCSWTEKTIHFCHQRRSESTAPPQKSPARARAARRRPRRGAGSVERGASCLNGRGRTRGRSASWWLVPPSTRPPTSAAWELPRARADADETRTRAARVCVLDSSVARTARYHHPNVGRVGEAFAFGFSAGRGRGRAERAPAGTRGHYVETP